MDHDITWRTSSHSAEGGGNCVEVALTGTVAGVRDSKNVTGPHLRFQARAWAEFLGKIKH
ncbi:DUF397 domain-containing protein [Umezawaea beigongshangensis]|uniref:DUF397 domain-containing protein n=1 Tax=Umezawaea beigongshangensis TaxID=2780383 RepID=UPI0027DC2679|nr:DUF397 domain-containing protein [Umezawaea beigongshangensis]